MLNNVYIVEVDTKDGNLEVLMIAADNEINARYKVEQEVRISRGLTGHNVVTSRVLVDQTLFYNFEIQEDRIWAEASNRSTRTWYFTLLSAIFGIVAGGIVVYFLTAGR